MKNRRLIWCSLLLTGAVSVSAINSVAAGENEYAMETEWYNESDTDNGGVESSNEMYISSNNEEVQEFSAENILSSNISQNELLSQNAIEAAETLSENIISDEYDVKSSDVSVNQSMDIEACQKPLNVLFPTEIPFSIILTNDDGTKGLIYSKRFCIENRGFDDVCISMQGVCEGENKENYVISGSSVEKNIVQGRKNAWLYMQWENENGTALEKPKTVIGDINAPAEEKIILKAPIRNRKGSVIGDNSESKIYFSVFGDLNSDMGEAWRSDELELKLNLFMETMESAESENPNSDVSLGNDLLDSEHSVSADEQIDTLDENEIENIDENRIQSVSENKMKNDVLNLISANTDVNSGINGMNESPEK